MKLYLYDHCPFCVRARMIFGLRAVPVENIYLLNDDEDTPISLIGVKQVPILEKPDGTVMGESLDIVRFVDEYAGGDRLDEQVRPTVQTWLRKVGQYGNKLVQPRDVLLGLPEFATQEAVDYFVRKKEAAIGDFQNHLANTPEYLAYLHDDLAELVPLLLSEHALNGQVGMEDILLFPLLRNLTMVRGLVLPQAVGRYVENMSKQSGVPLYVDRAL